MAVAGFIVLASFAGRLGPPGILAAMVVAIALLCGLPFLLNARRRPIATASAATAVIGALCLAFTAYADSRPYGQRIPVPERPLTASEARGLKLFADLQCASCHQIEGRGGRRIGPDLANCTARKRSRDYLARFIRDPQRARHSTAMPAYNLPESDLRSLADFILALDFSRYPARIVMRDQAR